MIAGCSTNWQPLPPLANQAPETTNLALLAHVYQYQGSGVKSTVNRVRELVPPAKTDRVSDVQTVNDQCLGAFIKGYQDEGGNTFDRNTRGRFKCVMRGALAWHAARYGAAAASEPLELMLYFNGGLNTKNAVLQTAFDSYRHVMADGYYPVYMPWPTGPFDTYFEDWLHVRAGRYTKTSAWPTLASVPIRPLNDLLLGIAATPGAWSTSAIESARATFFRDNAGFNVRVDDHLIPISKTPGGVGRIDANNNLYFEDGVDISTRNSLLSRTTDQAIYFGLTPVRLVTTPAIGPGFALWRNMVRRSRTAFRSRDEFPEEHNIVIDGGRAVDCVQGYEKDAHARQTCHPQGSGAFGQFFEWLYACIEGDDDCPLERNERDKLQTLRLTLIGHSMGTIVINEALNAFPDLPYSNIVYMAGAASVRASAEAVSPVLVRNQGCTRFYNLMLHPLNDALERTAGGALLSGSLLSYIDEYLEQPKTLPDRTVGQWRNLRQTKHLFPREARHWSLYRVFDRQAAEADDGSGALSWNPITHGSFNDKNMPFWREDFRKPVGVSFDPPRQACEKVFGRVSSN
ncbi:MAG: hypothetical protein AAF543_18225 [Pseudomonadota bacterium]